MLNDMYYGRIEPYCLALKWAKHDSLAKSLFPFCQPGDIIQLMSTSLACYSTRGINDLTSSVGGLPCLLLVWISLFKVCEKLEAVDVDHVKIYRLWLNPSEWLCEIIICFETASMLKQRLELIGSIQSIATVFD